MVESISLEDLGAGLKNKQGQYFKMKVLESHLSEEINEIVVNNIKETSILFSDRSTSYVEISEYVKVYITVKSTKEATVNTFRWVYIAIGNAKRTLVGIHHRIRGKYLQNYLNDFYYKLNWSYFRDKLFDRLLIAVTHMKTDNHNKNKKHENLSISDFLFDCI